MKKFIISSISVLLLAIGVTLSAAAPSQAAVSYRCWNPNVPSGANLVLSAYKDSRGGYDVHYHIYSYGAVQAYGVSIDGGSYIRIFEDEVYFRYGGNHTFTGKWVDNRYEPGIVRTCKLTTTPPLT